MIKLNNQIGTIPFVIFLLKLELQDPMLFLWKIFRISLNFPGLIECRFGFEVNNTVRVNSSVPFDPVFYSVSLFCV